jgi:zinc protease
MNRTCLSTVWALCLATGLLAPVALAQGLVGAPARTAAAAQEPAPRPVITVEGVTEYAFPNGFRLVLAPDASKPQTYVNLVVLVGARHEGLGETGMAHLLEHMLFKGSPFAPDPRLEFQRRGMRWNGTTNSDRTNYFASFAENPDTLAWYIRWQADILVNAFIRAEDLVSEMPVVRNEFERGENDPNRMLWQRVLQTAYLWHGYGRPPIGARSDIENVPIERLRAFYRQWYRPDNAVLVVSGKFDQASLLALVGQTFGRLPRPAQPMPGLYTREPVQDGEREVLLRRAGGQAALVQLYHTVQQSSPEDAALDVLGHVLSTAPSGRLHRALVETQLATGVGAGNASAHDPGYFYVSASMADASKVSEVRDVIARELARVAREGITAEELQRARNVMLTNFEQSVLDSSSLGRQLAESAAGGDWRLGFWWRDNLKRLTEADVQRAAAAYLVPSNRTVGLYLPAAPEALPQRAPAQAVRPASEVLGSYAGDQEAGARAQARLQQAQAQSDFELSAANIERSTVRGVVPVAAASGASPGPGLGAGQPAGPGLRWALLPKPAAGDFIHANLSLNWGNLQALQGRGPVGQAMSLLLSGTLQRSRQQFQDELVRLRADVDVDGGPYGLTLRLRVPRATWEPALRLVAEALRQPAFPEREFVLWKQRAIASLRARRGEPGSQANELLRRAFSPETVYPRQDPRFAPTLEQEVAELEAMTLDDVRAFHRDFAGAAHAEFAAVGALTSPGATGAQREAAVAQTAALLAELFGNWVAPVRFERVPRPLPATVDGAATRRVLLTPDKANALYAWQAAVPLAEDSRESAAAALANLMFGGGSAARLSTRVREREGLTYGINSFVGQRDVDNWAMVGVQASLAPQNLARLEAAVSEEISRVLRDGFTAEELASAKSAIAQQRRLTRASDSALAAALVNNLYRGRSFTEWQGQREQVFESITLEEANAAARRLLSAANRVTVVAGDFKQP